MDTIDRVTDAQLKQQIYKNVKLKKAAYSGR